MKLFSHRGHRAIRRRYAKEFNPASSKPIPPALAFSLGFFKLSPLTLPLSPANGGEGGGEGEK